ncbi:MAG: 50S ribosomal protein L22 [Patescibacteria group bacterium]
MIMEAKAKLKTYRQSPRKVRLLARGIAGKSVEEARAELNSASKRVAPTMLKLIKSAEANAQDRNIGSDLFIKRIWVDEGPTLFRMMPRAFGRAFIIRKRTSHINIVLAPKESEVSEERKDKETEKEKVSKVKKEEKGVSKKKLTTKNKTS